MGLALRQAGRSGYARMIGDDTPVALAEVDGFVLVVDELVKRGASDIHFTLAAEGPRLRRARHTRGAPG